MAIEQYAAMSLLPDVFRIAIHETALSPVSLSPASLHTCERALRARARYNADV